MRAKNIKSVLRKKFNHFVDHVKDLKVKQILKDNTIITGGSIASMLLGEDIKDFDLYLRTKEAAVAVATYFVKEFANNPPPRFKNANKEVEIAVQEHDDRVKIVVKSAGIAGEALEEEYQYFEATDPESGETSDYIERVFAVVDDAKDKDKDGEERPKYRPVFISSNAITLSNKVQIVIRFFGEPDEIHKNYDFVHCTNYWTSWNSHLELRPEAIEALLTKELKYVGSKYPLCSIIRTRKFIRRGWIINAGQYLKMAMQLNALDLRDPAVLEEQLVGVDMAYFQEVLNLLKAKDPDRIDSTYLMEIVDKVF